MDYVYLEYDHSQDILDRDNEYVGPFLSEKGAAKFRQTMMAPSAPVSAVTLNVKPKHAMTPLEFIKYQHRMD